VDKYDIWYPYIKLEKLTPWNPDFIVNIRILKLT
jgi:hypothetical protein